MMRSNTVLHCKFEGRAWDFAPSSFLSALDWRPCNRLTQNTCISTKHNSRWLHSALHQFYVLKESRTCLGGSCEPHLRSFRLFDSERFRMTVTGCLKMEAVWRIGNTRLLSWRTPANEANCKIGSAYALLFIQTQYTYLESNRMTSLSFSYFFASMIEHAFPCENRTLWGRNYRLTREPTQLCFELSFLLD